MYSHHGWGAVAFMALGAAMLTEGYGEQPIAPLKAVNSHGLFVHDREVVFVPAEGIAPGDHRPAPIPDSALETPQPPPLPRIIDVPYQWKQENLYMGWSGARNRTAYQEPGKPWILQMGLSTPGIGDTKTGSPRYKTWYRVSNDGGISFSPLRLVIQEGPEYDEMNPIDGVRIGKNGYNTPNNTPFVRGSNGELLIAIDIYPLGDDGELYNPLDTYTFTDVAVLLGRWTEDGSDIRWDLGERIRLGLDRGTRGLSEPSLVELDKPGTFMMVSRGSNSGRPDLPGYKWVSFSQDYCRTWSDPEPFTYADGTPAFSSATQSVLVRSRWNGRIYWIGNLHPVNPNCNFPRFPLVIGQVDERARGLIRDSILVLDTRHEGETERMQLSNFTVYEDRKTGDLIITVNRWDHGRGAPGASWYVVGLPRG